MPYARMFLKTDKSACNMYLGLKSIRTAAADQARLGCFFDKSTALFPSREAFNQKY